MWAGEGVVDFIINGDAFWNNESVSGQTMNYIF